MNLKNLTPRNLVGTRWEQFNMMLDSYFKEFKSEKLGILKTKFIPKESDKINLRDLVSRKGFDLVEVDGYASSLEYFQRRADTIPTEILWLLSEKCYQYVLKSFWLKGNTYSLELDVSGYYFPKKLITNTNSSDFDIQLLDQEEDIIYYYVGLIPVPNPPIETFQPALFLDTYEFPNLDLDDQRDGTNHFLIDFGFNVVEDKNIWISYNTLKALYETVQQIHRLKEIPHYRTNLDFRIKTDGSVKQKTYNTYDFDSTKESYVESVYVGGNFNLATYLEFGKNSYPVLSQEIVSGVNVSLGVLPISGIYDVISQSASGIELEYKITEYGQLNISGEVISSYSEVAVLDENFATIAYVKFPTIEYYNKMFTSMKITFSCE